MSLLKQIDDKGAVLEWSPIAKCPNLVALGTKVSIFPVINSNPIQTMNNI